MTIFKNVSEIRSKYKREEQLDEFEVCVLLGRHSMSPVHLLFLKVTSSHRWITILTTCVGLVFRQLVHRNHLFCLLNKYKERVIILFCCRIVRRFYNLSPADCAIAREFHPNEINSGELS